MCSIFGSITRPSTLANMHMNNLIRRSHERGRDGRGFLVQTASSSYMFKSIRRATGDEWNSYDFYTINKTETQTVIGNTRAEPTTEYVHEKHMDDQQPYSLTEWTIVHNGTIANDVDLRSEQFASYPSQIDSAAIVEQLEAHAGGNTHQEVYLGFQAIIRKLKGSFAILATHNSFPGVIFFACNYRPIWHTYNMSDVYIGSTEDSLPNNFPKKMVAPYSTGYITPEIVHIDAGNLYPKRELNNRVLVVCSGGMDSVVAAAALKYEGYNIELLHFQYGCRAQSPEYKAVTDAANALQCKVHFMSLPIYDPSDSPLLRADSKIAGGEVGAEFAHEWVPARNLVMLSIAVAIAEAKGFHYVGLGNNLEEAGAYPDNEPEFINRLNTALPFAVGDGKRVKIIMPVGNLMKHEIVDLGVRVGAPMKSTWSCYKSGEKHCGKCGPCHMRRVAFQINGLKDPMEYES